MTSDEKSGLNKEPGICVCVDPDDDEPIGSFFKRKNTRNPKRGIVAGSGNGKGKKTELRETIVTDSNDQDLSGLNLTLASLRKKLTATKRDSGSEITMEHYSVLTAGEPSTHVPKDAMLYGGFDVECFPDTMFKGPVSGDSVSDATTNKGSGYTSRGTFRESNATSPAKFNSSKINIQDSGSRFISPENQMEDMESSDHRSKENMRDSLSVCIGKVKSGLIKKTHTSSSKQRRGRVSNNEFNSSFVGASYRSKVTESETAHALKKEHKLPKLENNSSSVSGIIPVASNQSGVLENKVSVDDLHLVSKCTHGKLLIPKDCVKESSLVPLFKDDGLTHNNHGHTRLSEQGLGNLGSYIPQMEPQIVFSKSGVDFIESGSDTQEKSSQVDPNAPLELKFSASNPKMTLFEMQCVQDGLRHCSVGTGSNTDLDVFEKASIIAPSNPVEVDNSKLLRVTNDTSCQLSGDSCKESSDQSFVISTKIQSQCSTACNHRMDDSLTTVLGSLTKEETSRNGLDQFNHTVMKGQHFSSSAMTCHVERESDFEKKMFEQEKPLERMDKFIESSQGVTIDEFRKSVPKCTYDFPINQSSDNSLNGIISPNHFEDANMASLPCIISDQKPGFMARFLPEPKNKEVKLPVQRVVRKARKRRHCDMAYEGDFEWDFLIHEHGFDSNHEPTGNGQSSRMTEKSDCSNISVDVGSGGIAAVAAGLKARALSPVEKIKFKDILKRRGGLQEYLECRNQILGLWSSDVSRILLLADCGVIDTSCDSLVREIYKFLDERGYINVGIASNKRTEDHSDSHNYKLDSVKGSESCRGANDCFFFDIANEISATAEGKMFVAKPKELTSLREPEEGLTDHTQECLDANLLSKRGDFSALKFEPSSEVVGGKTASIWTPELKNGFYVVQNSSSVDLQWEDSDVRKRIIVIGAGPAGLTAARHLQRQGYLVTVLEGRTRIGGRVYTDRSSLSVPVDLGASIITGVEADVATERRPDPSSLICTQLGLELTVLKSDCPLYDVLSGEKVPSLLDETLEAEYNSLLDDMVLLVAHEGEHAMKMSLEDGLEYALKRCRLSRSVDEKNVDRKFSNTDDPHGEVLSPLERRVMDWHFANLEYGCAALLQEVSLPYWNQDDVYGGFGGAHCMIKGGYSNVIESLGEGLCIHLSHVVTNVSYSTKDARKVKVSTSNGREFFGDAVLVTVPLGCLKAETIKFSPSLPQWKNSSIQRLGFGVLNKIALEFPEVFWDDSVDYFGATAKETKQRGQCFMFWNVKKTVQAPVLIALVVGKAAIEGEDMNANDHVEHAVTVLRKLFGEDSVPDPVASVVTNWGKDPFSYGAYSYVAVGASGEDYDMLGRPVENCVFFAGEATCKEHPDTVGGAIMSGLREAVRMIDIFNTGIDNAAEVEAMEAAQKHSDSERNEVRDIVKRLDAVELSNVLCKKNMERGQILTRGALLQDIFCKAKTTAGRLHLAKELLNLPVETLKSFAGTRKGLSILNSWILDSMGKDGTQLLRHCVRILVSVSSDLLAVRLSGVGKTMKEKVCVHTSRDIRGVASQLVSMWIEVFRKEKKASNGGLKVPKESAAVNSSKCRLSRDAALGKPPLRNIAEHNRTSTHASAAPRGNHSSYKSDPKKSRKLETTTDAKSDINNSSTQGSGCDMDVEEEMLRDLRMSKEEKAAFAAADAAHAAALAAAEAYASSEAKCSSSLLHLPKIPSFHKFARREQYAQMDDSDFKRKWAGGDSGRQDSLSEIDSRNCRVQNWSVDFSAAAACSKLETSRMSHDNLSQRSHSNDIACQLSLKEISDESVATFTKAWVDTAGSVKDYHAIERWQSEAAAVDPDLLHSAINIRDEEDSSTFSKPTSLKLERTTNEGSFSQLTVNKELMNNQPRGPVPIKQAVVDYVASLLMPLYKSKKLEKEAYKTILKKAATKVMEQTTDAEKGMSVPEFLDFKRKNKIRSFVDKLIERHMVKPAG